MKVITYGEGVPKFIQSQSTIDLVDKLTPYVTFAKVPAATRFYYHTDGINMCYLIRSGLIRVRRGRDEIVITSLLTPNIQGISNLIPETAGLFLETLGESEIATLTTEQALRMVAETNSWELLAGHITKVSTNLFSHSMVLAAPTSYDVVRFHLSALMQEPGDIREATSAAKYILERTRLSRSTVMKMLSQLRQGKYIELDEGILKAINHLPARY